MLAKLLWNPEAGGRKLTVEFLEVYYGQAAARRFGSAAQELEECRKDELSPIRP